MIRRSIAFFTVGLMLMVSFGCSVDTELGGTPLPNNRPDTRIVGQPPTLLEAGFLVQFNWTGSDADGRVRGFQWKISDNGTDGISPRDTMTVDPLTGAVLNPWFYTQATDSLFFVLADQENFPADLDPDAPPIDPNDPDYVNLARSYRTHTLWIRAVDDRGAVDPSPAQMSFTSATLVPKAWGVWKPGLSINEAVIVPTSVTLGYQGEDPDFDLGVPARWRFLWRSGEALDGTIVVSRFRYENRYSELIDFDDPDWWPWEPYGATESDRRITLSGADGEAYLFAVQVQDTAGAVSVGRGYQREVINVKVDATRFRPAVTVFEPYLGEKQSDFTSQIAAGQPINLSWFADSDFYNGSVVSYRHGWDIDSVDDPNDSGWAVQPGLSEVNRFAQEYSFQEGIHRFLLKVVDNSGVSRTFIWTFNVIPSISPEFQYPLMVLDQVVDGQTNAWPGRGGSPSYDKEEFRNGYWRFLEGSGGVSNFSWDEDRWDHLDLVTYGDLVWYKVALIYARYSSSQLMFNEFRAVSNKDKYVWLAPYQLRGGNLFLVGAQGMESFLENQARYMVPIIFDTGETTHEINGTTYITGFGQKELPGGEMVERGPLQYPYLTAGISSLDWAVPQGKFIYGRSTLGVVDRTPGCSALKALVLDPAFKSNHQVGQGVIADRIGTNSDIDWRDDESALSDSLGQVFGFTGDEFVNFNISSRSTPLIEQNCAEGPEGLCIEPMFRGLARFDWLRERRWADGPQQDLGWPSSRYGSSRLDEICGSQALTSFISGEIVLPKSSARTNGLTYGYMSYKTITDKPSFKPDVYWGFDPYRFDRLESQKAIRWVLEFFNLEINQ